MRLIFFLFLRLATLIRSQLTYFHFGHISVSLYLLELMLSWVILDYLKWVWLSVSWKWNSRCNSMSNIRSVWQKYLSRSISILGKFFFSVAQGISWWLRNSKWTLLQFMSHFMNWQKSDTSIKINRHLTVRMIIDELTLINWLSIRVANLKNNEKKKTGDRVFDCATTAVVCVLVIISYFQK